MLRESKGTQRSRVLLAAGATLAVVVTGATAARAIPTLQLYIKDATYDLVTETWVTDGSSFTLWVIGNVGADGPISDAKLSAAYDSSETVSIVLTPTTATGTGIDDLSKPIDPIPTAGGGDGAVPTLNDGSSLTKHGVFGLGTSFLEWELGDFVLTDSPVGDFIDDYPTSFPSSGQINAYDVSVTGSSQVHFDAYGSIVVARRNGSHTQSVTAPFSHDAGLIPEPNSMTLYGLAVLFTGIAIRRRR